MAERAVIENLTRTRARAIQERVDSSDQNIASRRRWRIPELAIGVVLMCGGALGAILLSRSGDSVVVVVGSAHNLDRGNQIRAQDLIALEVPLSFAASFVSGDEAAALIGQTMLINVKALAPLTTAMMSQTDELKPSEALVSAAVNVGNFPSDLTVGDSVRVVTVPDIALSESYEPTMFDEVVIVWSLVQPAANNDFALITFRSSLDLSLALAGAGEVHLARVAGVASKSIGESAGAGTGKDPGR